MSWSHVVVGVLSHASGFALALLIDVVKRRLGARLAAAAAAVSWGARVESCCSQGDRDDALAALATRLRADGHEAVFSTFDDPDHGRRMVLIIDPAARPRH